MSERVKPESDPAKCRDEMWRLWRACERASKAIGAAYMLSEPIEWGVIQAAYALADELEKMDQREANR